MNKSTKEIEKEIEKLKQIKSNASPKAEVDFGGVYPDTIHSLIDAKINVLEQRMSYDYIMDHFSVDSDDGDCCMIISCGVKIAMEEASEWLGGIFEASPSKNWNNA
ncbi:MAG: hypothetical protein PHW73_10320 [Atribacterota bacterium]|nr:hypothetical protein [Atribacterota bacterium]